MAVLHRFTVKFSTQSPPVALVAISFNVRGWDLCPSLLLEMVILLCEGCVFDPSYKMLLFVSSVVVHLSQFR